MAIETAPPKSDLQSLIGTWRRFGVVGPLYEITGVDQQLADGDWLMRVRVLDTGEEVGYKLTDLIEDPQES